MSDFVFSLLNTYPSCLCLISCTIYALACSYSYFFIKLYKRMFSNRASLYDSGLQIPILENSDSTNWLKPSFYIKNRLAWRVTFLVFSQVVYETANGFYSLGLIHFIEFLFFLLSAALLRHDYYKKSKFYKQGLFWLLNMVTNVCLLLFLDDVQLFFFFFF